MKERSSVRNCGGGEAKYGQPSGVISEEPERTNQERRILFRPIGWKLSKILAPQPRATKR
jgi:hypothetical protein